MNKIDITVIIPTWNRANVIKVAIISALKQTYTPLEILVCDDGSTDETKRIISEIDNPIVKWVSGKRSGSPAIPRNKGIALAKGNWIAFLDSDDEWSLEKLESQVKIIHEKNVRAVCTNAWQKKRKKTPKLLMLPPDDLRLSYEKQLHINLVHTSTVMVKRDLFNIVNGFPVSKKLIVGEDYALWLRISAITEFYYISKPLINYLDEPKTSIRALGSDWHFQQNAVIHNFIDWLQSNNSIKNKNILIKRAKRKLIYIRIKYIIRRLLFMDILKKNH